MGQTSGHLDIILIFESWQLLFVLQQGEIRIILKCDPCKASEVESKNKS